MNVYMLYTTTSISFRPDKTKRVVLYVTKKMRGVMDQKVRKNAFLPKDRNFYYEMQKRYPTETPNMQCRQHIHTTLEITSKSPLTCHQTAVALFFASFLVHRRHYGVLSCFGHLEEIVYHFSILNAKVVSM